ncbi:helix-turn-helix domain-containing protein [uncultured Dokdonia sp.]|uniref:helix-turn-helix domain-containing protein n=1 Tax=uncultured Dokdonia sp. TaxID=575653 RepID=UPI00260B9CB0|nr:helix-turn-helix domain-containing protein [uncultured Dokdonia sp.]
MEVICLEEEAFYNLFDKVATYIDQKYQQDTWGWIDGKEAMRLLNISSKTTLQKLRDEGKIRFSQPQPRVILYDRNSINEYLNANARETF